MYNDVVSAGIETAVCWHFKVVPEWGQSQAKWFAHVVAQNNITQHLLVSEPGVYGGKWCVRYVLIFVV